ncbi:fimbrial protein [Kalamiella sp. sgz302252]|uniref:fimbrial protein n=1 Tax=Pantoea sp. sgz302252 TaxID=3341827 RepID=UPI0036D33E6B
MKKNVIAVSALALAIFSTGAFATEGTVNFEGEIIAQGCDISSNTDEQTVKFGKIAKSAFPEAGSTAGAKEFSIVLTACPDTLKKASVLFEGTQSENDSTILALSTEAVDGISAATGVGIRIVESDSREAVTLHQNTSEYDIKNSSATLNFIASYIRLGDTEVVPGVANSVANFTIAYN